MLDSFALNGRLMMLHRWNRAGNPPVALVAFLAEA
jgi:hypothetical protein